MNVLLLRQLGYYNEENDVTNEGRFLPHHQSTTFRIPDKYCKVLNKVMGENFAQQLRKILNVTVNVDRSNVNNVLCTLNGPKKSLEKAQLALENYCTNGGKNYNYKDTTFATDLLKLDDLRDNLEKLSVIISWHNKALALYGNINGIILKIKTVCCEGQFQDYVNNLQYLYMKLNTIIIAKLRLGKDKEHMEILENGQCITDELKESFNYVFNSNRIIYPNYEELISRLPHCDEKPEKDVLHLMRQLPHIRRQALVMCRKYRWDDKHIHFMTQFSLIVINNYPHSDVLSYKNEFDELKKQFDEHELEVKLKKKFKKTRKLIPL